MPTKANLATLNAAFGIKGFDIHFALRNWPEGKAMERVNEILGGHGVESLALADGTLVDYVNLGDTYATTLLLIGVSYFVGSWGDLVEENGSMDLNEAILRAMTNL